MLFAYTRETKPRSADRYFKKVVFTDQRRKKTKRLYLSATALKQSLVRSESESVCLGSFDRVDEVTPLLVDLQ